MKMLHMAAFILLVVGGVNWGLVGLLNLNLVSSILGGSGLEKLVYILVGASAVWLIATHKESCKVCSAK